MNDNSNDNWDWINLQNVERTMRVKPCIVEILQEYVNYNDNERGSEENDEEPYVNLRIVVHYEDEEEKRRWSFDLLEGVPVLGYG